MRKKMIFSLLVLLFSLGFDALPRSGEANQRCTIYCDTDPSIQCSSEVGDCWILYGGYNVLYCDGVEYRCLPYDEPKVSRLQKEPISAATSMVEAGATEQSGMFSA